MSKSSSENQFKPSSDLDDYGLRIAKGVEFIAQCLGRIESHLETIAERGETNPIGETIHQEMCDLRDLIDRKKAYPL